MKGLFKFLLVGLAFVPVAVPARTVVSRAARITNTPTSGYTYNYMYPYLNNQMRRELNPGNTNAQSTSPINAIVRTEPLAGTGNTNQGTRRVVARSGRMQSGLGTTSISRADNSGAVRSSGNANNNIRRVAPRVATARATRLNNTNTATVVQSATDSRFVSSNQCLSDYTDCMNSYCVRDDMAYNRCYCSSRLSQIESTYEPQIDSLVKQIMRAKSVGNWTDEEMAEYWNSTIGRYVGENAWEKLDDALNINWSDAGERMQGQGAYLTGHQYCVNHLTNCGYVAVNLRDVYRSEISRDCDAYEKSLERLKTALETALETYNNN